MNHMEFAATESAALAPTKWEHWITEAESLAGHHLDGDQRADGYSYDGAYAAWKAGRTPAAYVAEVGDVCADCLRVLDGHCEECGECACDDADCQDDDAEEEN